MYDFKLKYYSINLYHPNGIYSESLFSWLQFLDSLACFSLSAAASRCSGVSVRVRYGFLPNRNGQREQSLTGHSLTSFAWSQQQSRHFARIAFTGFVSMRLTSPFYCRCIAHWFIQVPHTDSPFCVLVSQGGIEPPYTLWGPYRYKQWAITYLATGRFL